MKITMDKFKTITKEESIYLRSNRLKIEDTDTQRLNQEIKNRILISVIGGNVDPNCKGYKALKLREFHIWGNIVVVLRMIENLLKKNNISSTKIVSTELIKVSMLLRIPVQKDLITCLDNRDIILQFENVVFGHTPKDKLLNAVLVIQKHVRRIICQTYVNIVKDMHHQIRLIQKVLKQLILYRKTQRLIYQKNTETHEKFLELTCQAKQQAKDSAGDENSKKIIEIHVNSLGYDDFKKFSVLSYIARQNFQLSRIFRLMDRNIELVYIAAKEIPTDVLAYYMKILEMAGVEKPTERLHVIYPENMEFFEKNDICLSDLLYYSPKTISKVKEIISGKKSVIVNGYPSFRDEIISIALNSPIMTGVPSFNKVLSQKFAAKSIFNSLKVPTLIFSNFVKNQRELVMQLAKLIIENPTIEKWTIKLNDEFNGRGMAQFSTECLQIMNEMYQKDSTIDSNVCNLRDLRSYIKKFWPTYLSQLTPDLFPNLKEYITIFEYNGCIIEEMPSRPFKSVAAVGFLNMLGHFTYITSYEKILIGKAPMAYFSPQHSLKKFFLKAQLKAIGRKLYSNGIYGYFTVDF